MGKAEKTKIDWMPVILFVFTFVFSLCGWAYTKDMSYLRESITHIRLSQEKTATETKDKYEGLEQRVRKIEIKIGD